VDDISARVKLKSSVGRALQRDIVEMYPAMESYVENLISKKAELVEARWCVHARGCVCVLSRKAAVG
jgi:hypothetical protein